MIKRNRLLIHAAKWFNFKSILLTERNQTLKVTYDIKKRQNYRDRKLISGCQRLVDGEVADYKGDT